MKFIALLGRILFSLIFIFSGISHFAPSTAAYAAAQGVPMASVLVPVSGLLATLGGLSIALGYKAKLGGLLIILFLIPVTFMMHRFWTISDPMEQRINMIMFMKNMSMLGGALLITYFGAGPLSIDERLYKKRRTISPIR